MQVPPPPLLLLLCQAAVRECLTAAAAAAAAAAVLFVLFLKRVFANATSPRTRTHGRARGACARRRDRRSESGHAGERDERAPPPRHRARRRAPPPARCAGGAFRWLQRFQTGQRGATLRGAPLPLPPVEGAARGRAQRRRSRAPRLGWLAHAQRGERRRLAAPRRWVYGRGPAKTVRPAAGARRRGQCGRGRRPPRGGGRRLSAPAAW